MFDFHVHSNNSFDSIDFIDKFCIEAIKKGIREICFTEHFNVNKIRRTYGFMNFEKYFSEIETAREKYKDKLSVLKGIELCEPHFLKEEYEKNLIDKNLDFILGSVHNIYDSGLAEICSSYGDDRVYKIYFDEFYNMVRGGDIDIAAHLDLMNRYAISSIGNYNFFDHYDIIKEILKVLIVRGIGFEINTSGLRNNLKDIHPKVEVLKLYKELGGEIITIGSDAHKAKDVGEGFEFAIKLLNSLEFKYVFTFEGRKPKAHPISEIKLRRAI